jgi:hypothetical protein
LKRGIFHKRSIDVCLDGMVFATPMRPTTLVFAPGEEIVVAVPKHSAGEVGEYQFLFRIEGYVEDSPKRAEQLFGRAAWRHIYRLASATTIRPFSLDELITRAGDRGDLIWERYHGQTQHHRIVRDIFPEDEPLFRAFLQPGTEPVWTASAIVDDHELAPIRRRVRERSPADIVRRLRAMDKQSETTPPGKQYRPGRSQKRNAEFTELVRALYDYRCQVCGIQLCDRDGKPGRSQVHHFEGWDGDRSDRTDNVICVCPNDHARFELGVLRWKGGELQGWADGAWGARELALDRHLLVNLGSEADVIA